MCHFVGEKTCSKPILMSVFSFFPLWSRGRDPSVELTCCTAHAGFHFDVMSQKKKETMVETCWNEEQAVLVRSEFQRQHNSRHFDDDLWYGCGKQGLLSRTSFEPQSMLRRLQRTTQNRLSCVTFAPRPLRHRVAGATDRAQNRAVMCTDHGGNSCFTAPQFWSSVLLDTLARVTFSFSCLPVFCISSQSHRFLFHSCTHDVPVA